MLTTIYARNGKVLIIQDKDMLVNVAQNNRLELHREYYSGEQQRYTKFL